MIFLEKMQFIHLCYVYKYALRNIGHFVSYIFDNGKEKNL